MNPYTYGVLAVGVSNASHAVTSGPKRWYETCAKQRSSAGALAQSKITSAHRSVRPCGVDSVNKCACYVH